MGIIPTFPLCPHKRAAAPNYFSAEQKNRSTRRVLLYKAIFNQERFFIHTGTPRLSC